MTDRLGIQFEEEMERISSMEAVDEVMDQIIGIHAPEDEEEEKGDEQESGNC
jgi:hypothetical protein